MNIKEYISEYKRLNRLAITLGTKRKMFETNNALRERLRNYFDTTPPKITLKKLINTLKQLGFYAIEYKEDYDKIYGELKLRIY